MPGPMSAPGGYGREPHKRCQSKERCTGPGCRILTGKTRTKRTGEPTAKVAAELAAAAKAFAEAANTENQESAA